MTVYPYRWRDARRHGVRRRAGRRAGRRAVRGARRRARRPGQPLAGRDGAVVTASTGSCCRRPTARRSPSRSPTRAPRWSGPACATPAAVARWLAPQVRDGAGVAVVAAGERWPDGSLRPAVEDLWGAGAVLAALLGDAAAGSQPRGRDAVDGVPRRRRRRSPTALPACASGQELVVARLRRRRRDRRPGRRLHDRARALRRRVHRSARAGPRRRAGPQRAVSGWIATSPASSGPATSKAVGDVGLAHVGVEVGLAAPRLDGDEGAGGGGGLEDVVAPGSPRRRGRPRRAPASAGAGLGRLGGVDRDGGDDVQRCAVVGHEADSTALGAAL